MSKGVYSFSWTGEPRDHALKKTTVTTVTRAVRNKTPSCCISEAREPASQSCDNTAGYGGRNSWTKHVLRKRVSVRNTPTSSAYKSAARTGHFERESSVLETGTTPIVWVGQCAARVQTSTSNTTNILVVSNTRRLCTKYPLAIAFVFIATEKSTAALP